MDYIRLDPDDKGARVLFKKLSKAEAALAAAQQARDARDFNNEIGAAAEKSSGLTVCARARVFFF